MLFPIVAVSVGMHTMRNGWAALLLYHAGMVGMMVLFGDRAVMRRRITHGFRLRSALALMALCALSGILVYLLWPYIYFRATPFGPLLSEYGLGPVSRVVFILYFSSIHPVIEESYWRGWLARDVGGVGEWLQDLAFGGFHVFVLVLFIHPLWIVVAFTVLVTIARTWRHIDQRYGGLALPILSHAIADLTIVVAGFLAAQ